MTADAGVTYSTTGAGCTCFTTTGGAAKTGAVTNMGRADSEGRSAPISVISTISACATWWIGAVTKLSEVWRDGCRDENGRHGFCEQRRSDFDHLHSSACATRRTGAVPKLSEVRAGFQGYQRFSPRSATREVSIASTTCPCGTSTTWTTRTSTTLSMCENNGISIVF